MLFTVGHWRMSRHTSKSLDEQEGMVHMQMLFSTMDLINLGKTWCLQQ